MICQSMHEGQEISRTPTMGHKRLATGPPNVTEDVFEDFLVTDDLLVDYFNEFLSLPTFTEAVKFNKTYGIFEVISNYPDQLNQQIKKLLQEYQLPNPIYNVTRSITRLKTQESSANNLQLNIEKTYSIMCLNREQGVQWVKKERLPAFLKSDCYFEYRLAKLLSQVKLRSSGVSLQLDPQYQPWTYRREVESIPSPQTENEELKRKFFVTLGQDSPTQTKEWFTMAKQNELTMTTDSSSRPITWVPVPGGSTLYNEHDRNQALHSVSNTQTVKKSMSGLFKNTHDTQEEDEYAVSIADSPIPSPVQVYIEQKQNEPQEQQENIENRNVPVFPTMEDFSFYYVDQVMKSAVSKLNGEKVEQSADKIDVFSLSEVVIQPLQNTRAPSTTSESTIEEEIDVSDNDELDVLESSHNKHEYSHIRTQKDFERFKSFIKGTSGKKLFWLWMDIERLKAMTDIKRKQSHLNKMKKMYLVATGDHYLQAEVLTNLDLLDTNQWSENHLHSVQDEIVRRLLLYWGPRFCLTDTPSANTVGADLQFWYDRQLRPKRDADPFAQTITLLPLRPKSCAPRISVASYPVLEKSFASPSKSKSASFTRQSDSLILAKLKPEKRLTKSLPGSAIRSSQNRTRIRPVSCYASTVCKSVTKNVGPKVHRNAPEEEDYFSHVDSSSSILKSSKMEEMLQALYLDRRAGYFFATFCEQSGNKLWESGVNFWFDLQSYHHLFYQETLQPFKLCRQSQHFFILKKWTLFHETCGKIRETCKRVCKSCMNCELHFKNYCDTHMYIFGTYLAPSASMDIGVDQNIRKEIYQKLDPPFEDLFDSAEEYILTLLLSAWTQMTESDRQAYGKVELVEESRQLESANYRKLRALQQEKASRKDEDQSLKSAFVPPPDIPKEPNLWELVPEEYRNYNLGTLVRHRMELEHFHSFLEDHFASMDLMCWIDLEQFRRMPHKDKEKRQEKSKDIKNKYLNKKYFFGPNSPATRDQQEQVMNLAGGWGKILHDRLSSAVLIEIQKYVRMRIEKKWLPMFLSTEEYRERQKMQSQMKDVAEDVLFQTNKKKLGVWKHLDSKWISSSKEIIAFRKALLNNISANQFQRFISLKGDFFENGLLFWQEVQKYKELCHSHCDDATIQNKITAIINCFINSSIPPALQIDIPPEQAEKILERRRDLGPYVFREAQMTIFSIMFKFWPEFCEFRRKLTDEKIVPLLERKKAKKVQQMKQKMREQEMLAQHQQQEIKRKGTLLDIYGDSESSYSEELFSGREVYGRSRNVSWSYSKYLEALEQERMLLKIQEDLEKKTASSVISENSSVYSIRTDDSKRSGKTFSSSHGQTQRVPSAARH